MAIQYRTLTPADAELLRAGIERVYGNTYPIPEFYDPAYLRNALQSALLHSVVALNEEGDVVGCMSTVLEEIGDVTADGSALTIAPEYRGQGIVAQLGRHSAQIYQQLRLGGLHLYALALHGLVQEQVARAGGHVTGVLPVWFSRTANVAGYEHPDVRIGAVTLYMPLGPMPARKVYLPSRYFNVLQKIYQRLDLGRELIPCTEQVPPSTPSVVRLERKSANQQLRIVVDRVGEDLATIMVRAIADAADFGAEVVYVDIPLNDIANEWAVSCARREGFFFGALLVDRRGSDRLRLQRYSAEVAAPGQLVVASPEAAHLLEYVLQDQAGI